MKLLQLAIGSGAAPFLALSDARVKDNIAPIGILFDGTPVYSFNYIGDRTPRMGLIAQDVERRRPDAVGSVGGVKAVDYGKATQRARSNLIHVWLIHVVILNVLQHAFEDSKLSVRIVRRLLSSSRNPASNHCI
jgi:hypothetical protein